MVQLVFPVPYWIPKLSKSGLSTADQQVRRHGSRADATWLADPNCPSFRWRSSGSDHSGVPDAIAAARTSGKLLWCSDGMSGCGEVELTN